MAKAAKKPVALTHTQMLQLDAVIRNAPIIHGEYLRRKFHRFVSAAWPVLEPGTEFQDNWHIHAICDHLEAVSRGEIQRLIINMPPRFMKSMLVSVLWPAWTWANIPERRFLTASYAKELATRDAVQSRRLMDSVWYKSRYGYRFRFTSDQNVKSRYVNDKLGHRVATSVDAAATGEGGDILLVDDPISAKDSNSQVARQTATTWWKETMSTRYNDPKTGAAVIVMQRLAQDDLTGYLLEQGGWEHLCLPMRYDSASTKTTVLGFKDPRKKDGELLFPARFDEAKTKRLEEELGSYGASGQLQQSPTPRGGIFFEWEKIEIVETAPKMQTVLRYWDKAGTEGGGAYTAGVKMGLGADGLFYILDVERGQWAAPRREMRIKAHAQLDGISTKIWIEQEPGSGGKESAEATIKNLAGYSIRAERATGDKETRAEPFSVQVEAGNVRMLKASWNKEYLDELRVFPVGKYRDQVDASSGAFNKLARPTPVGLLLPGN